MPISSDFPRRRRNSAKTLPENYSQFIRKPNIRLDYSQGMNGSIGKILSEATARLGTAEISEPRLEAVSLLMHTLNVDRAFIIAHPEHELKCDQSERYRGFVARRANHEPLQYITGVQEFFNLKFEVTPDVLIPRPETELIVEATLDVWRSAGAPLIADVGTGSGCIAISLLHEISNARAIGIDISSNALAIARRNAERQGLRDRLELVQANGLSAFGEQARFSVIVSNPPYVPVRDVESLQPEVRDHEPLSALVAGEDGLSHVRPLVQDAANVLQTDGYLIFEIGSGQSAAVQALVNKKIWDLIDIKNDLQQIPRALVLRKK
jgi:release factor glutamine methyltransferase